jgi:hypothetical protein
MAEFDKVREERRQAQKADEMHETDTTEGMTTEETSPETQC